VRVSHCLSTCTFCGVGCGIYLESQQGEITGAYPSMSHPANLGRICVRGWHVHEVASSPDRLRTPLVRRDGVLVPASLDEAYDTIVTNLTRIKEQHGPDSIAFLDSARCANEDGYLFQKFARAVIGTNNVDQGTSFYRTATVDVLRRMLGIAAATNPIHDIFASKVIILNEIDIGQQLPTIGGHIIRAHLDGAKLIVVGERRHRVVEHADIFLNTKPGTAGYLYAAMAKILVDRGIVDLDFIRARCTGYEAFLDNIRSFDILFAARRCDVDPALIEQAALMYARNRPGMLMYAAGSEDIGQDALSAMVNLVMLTGNLGKSGAGIMPLSEHNNAQGGSDMGVMPQYLPGYVPVSDTQGRESFGRQWGATLPAKPGLDAASVFAQPGRIKALWLDRHNPVVSATYCDALEALRGMDFIVLMNLLPTQTAQLAHVVLPIAAFGEEDVTFTSTERRVQIAPKVVEPAAGVRCAWQHIAEVARRMGTRWSYKDSRDVLREITSVVPDYAEMTPENLRRDYGRQWPCTHDSPLGTPVLFTRDKASRPFSFASLHITPPEEAATKDFPFVVTFGHSLYYWHQNALVQHSGTLKREYGILLLDYPDGFVEINDQDAKNLSVRDGQRIRVVTPDGSAQTCARVTAEVRPGIIYVPFFLQDVMRTLGKECGKRGKTMHARIEKAG
jgi:formate dehydrogenase (coenzyme F420) alpha subunit